MNLNILNINKVPAELQNISDNVNQGKCKFSHRISSLNVPIASQINSDCPVCLKDLLTTENGIYVTYCKHTAHKECIEEEVNKSSTAGLTMGTDIRNITKCYVCKKILSKVKVYDRPEDFLLAELVRCDNKPCNALSQKTLEKSIIDVVDLDSAHSLKGKVDPKILSTDINQPRNNKNEECIRQSLLKTCERRSSSYENSEIKGYKLSIFKGSFYDELEASAEILDDGFTEKVHVSKFVNKVHPDILSTDINQIRDDKNEEFIRQSLLKTCAERSSSYESSEIKDYKLSRVKGESYDELEASAKILGDGFTEKVYVSKLIDIT